MHETRKNAFVSPSKNPDEIEKKKKKIETAKLFVLHAIAKK